jgi:hypothetical protein
MPPYNGTMLTGLRSHKRWWWLLAAAFVWMHLATAAYACVSFGGASGKTQVSMSPCASMSGMDIDVKQPNLCKAHCDKDKQRAAADQSFDAVGMVPPTLGPSWPWVMVEAESRPRGPARGSGPPPGAPPLFITFLVLRN